MPDYKQEVENISKFLAQYNENAGTNGFVLGCSGGIDSALCLALLKRGVHSKNIIAVALPCNSSENSLLDAQKLADNLNIKLEVIDLQNSYNSIIENLEKTNNKNKEISNLVKGNLAARLRMVQLYTMANLNHMLVCGTSNRSEIKVGYGTKFGDFAEDLSPLGNIYKTQVFEIAKLMPEIPKSILEKDPSADLWSNQTDEHDFGMSYRELDRILEAIERKDDIALKSFPAKKLEKVKYMMKAAYHKNNPAPMYEIEQF